MSDFTNFEKFFNGDTDEDEKVRRLMNKLLREHHDEAHKILKEKYPEEFV